MLALLLLLTLGVRAEEPVDVDRLGAPLSASWFVGSATLKLDDGGLTLDGRSLDERVIATPAVREDWIVWTSESLGAIALRGVHLDDGAWGEVQDLVTEGRPDRVAIDPRSPRAVYVAGSAIPGIWLIDLETMERRALTNAGLQRSPGGPPSGFVPLPHRAPPRFEGDTLVWDSERGRHTIAL